ncbi:MAG: glycoside hydrolase family 88 protein [Clostridia bacterium]|nr:glycoside hydrolase family 88 protein [Clostridia bacterium]
MYEFIEKYIGSLIDGSTPERPLWNIEQIRSGKKASWNYIDGCMLIALMRLYKMKKDEKYYDFVKKYIDFFVGEDGKIATDDKKEYNLDNINEGRVLFDLYDICGEQKYRLAADTLFSQIETQPRNIYGSFWHKKIYHDQVWLDGLFMAQVFSYRYREVFGDGDVSDVISQFRNVERFMRDPVTGLYYHGFDASKTLFWADDRGLSKNFWLRSMGWYFAALADVTDCIKDESLKGEFRGYLKRAVDGVLKFRDEDSKMFYQVVDKGGEEGNYLETSGSALIAYAIMRSVNAGNLDASYAKYAAETFDGIIEKYVTVDGDDIRLDGICLVAGLGPESRPERDGSFGYYISEPVVSTDAKGVAPFIMCYVEILKFKSNN